MQRYAQKYVLMCRNAGPTVPTLGEKQTEKSRESWTRACRENVINCRVFLAAVFMCFGDCGTEVTVYPQTLRHIIAVNVQYSGVKRRGERACGPMERERGGSAPLWAFTAAAAQGVVSTRPLCRAGNGHGSAENRQRNKWKREVLFRVDYFRGKTRKRSEKLINRNDWRGLGAHHKITPPNGLSCPAAKVS